LGRHRHRTATAEEEKKNGKSIIPKIFSEKYLICSKNFKIIKLDIVKTKVT